MTSVVFTYYYNLKKAVQESNTQKKTIHATFEDIKGVINAENEKNTPLFVAIKGLTANNPQAKENPKDYTIGNILEEMILFIQSKALENKTKDIIIITQGDKTMSNCEKKIFTGVGAQIQTLAITLKNRFESLNVMIMGVGPNSEKTRKIFETCNNKIAFLDNSTDKIHKFLEECEISNIDEIKHFYPTVDELFEKKPTTNKQYFLFQIISDLICQEFNGLSFKVEPPNGLGPTSISSYALKDHSIDLKIIENAELGLQYYDKAKQEKQMQDNAKQD